MSYLLFCDAETLFVTQIEFFFYHCFTFLRNYPRAKNEKKIGETFNESIIKCAIESINLFRILISLKLHSYLVWKTGFFAFDFFAFDDDKIAD